MSKLESLEGLVQKSGAVASSVPAAAGKAGKAKKAPKARDPSAAPRAPNAWILFTSRVRSVINESGVLGEKKLGKECTQFCSSLKEDNADLDSWAAETILARFGGWTVPEQSKMAAAGISFAKKSKGSEATVEAAAEPAAVSEKPKRVISDEQKAKMKAGRERAAAEKKAAAAGSAPVPAAAAVPVAVAVAAAEAEAEAEAEEWKPMKLKVGGVIKPYLWNPANNHCYNRETDGGQGEWAGVFNPKSKTIDSSVPEPSEEVDFELEA